MRFYLTISSALAPTVAILFWIGQARDLEKAQGPDLAAVFGSACLDCKVDNTGPCVANSCTKVADGVWRKTTGMNISPISCFQVGSGAPGTTTCTNDTPKVCLKKQTCTSENCPDGSCGPASTTEADTRCELGSYLCKG